jgi:proteic killer suppression protein
VIHIACDQELPGQDRRSRLRRRKSEGFPADLVKVARRKLRYLSAAGDLGDLRSPPGNRLEALAGDRKGQHSIRINDQFRVCVVWTAQGPAEVEIVDYH